MPLSQIADCAVFFHRIALHGDLITRFRVTNVIDWNVVMLAPEKWHRRERFFMSHHIEGCGLSLTLRDNPMLDANLVPSRAFRGLVVFVTQADIRRTVPASAVLETTSNCEAQPVVLEIDGAAAFATGLRFYKAGPEIVLTEHVPVEFIRFP